MDYITAKEAAEKWNISMRSVQQYCVDGKLNGAAKLGTQWIIPRNAEKPGRAKAVKNEPSAVPVLTGSEEVFRKIPMPLMNSAFSSGCVLNEIENIEDEDTKSIALAEYYYFIGREKNAIHIAEKYIGSDDFILKVSALWIYFYGSLSVNKAVNARKALEEVCRMYGELKESTPKAHRAITVCLYNVVLTELHLLKPDDLPQVQHFVHMMPPGMRLFILYIQARYAYSCGQYGVAIGIAETGLVLEDTMYPVPTIYLHLACAMCYIHLKHPQLSKEHLLAAWDIARQDDFLEPFGQLHSALFGLLEVVIKNKDAASYRKIVSIRNKFSAGWCELHNSITGDSIPSILTPTEFSIAMMVSHEWTNKEIAAYLGIKENTVKNHVSDIMSKLCISRRNKLKELMPR